MGDGIAVFIQGVLECAPLLQHLLGQAGLSVQFLQLGLRLGGGFFPIHQFLFMFLADLGEGGARVGGVLSGRVAGPLEAGNRILPGAIGDTGSGGHIQHRYQGSHLVIIRSADRLPLLLQQRLGALPYSGSIAPFQGHFPDLVALLESIRKGLSPQGLHEEGNQN